MQADSFFHKTAAPEYSYGHSWGNFDKVSSKFLPNELNCLYYTDNCRAYEAEPLAILKFHHMNQFQTQLLTGRTLASLGLVLCVATGVSADLIRMKHGGEVRGKIVSKKSLYPNRLSIQTVSGATVSIPKTEVEFITRRSIVYEEYEIQVRLTPSDVASLWTLSQWCQKNRLKPQRKKHLAQILELDPQNEQAHKALGHIKREGKWTTQEEYMLSRGYVRYKRKYMTPEEKELLENSAAEREKQHQWHSKIYTWTKWLTGRSDKQRQIAVEHFRSLTDPTAVPALGKVLANHSSRDVRLLYIESLTHFDTPASVTSLVKQGLFDVDQGIRSRAVNAVPEARKELASSVLIQHLTNKQNVVVRRAASALSKLGDKSAIPYLIDALVTTHKYRIQVDVPTVGFTMGQGGNISQGTRYQLPPDIMAGLLTGQIPPENISIQGNAAPLKTLRTVRVNQQNPEVLEALKSMTKANFGYDERTWRLWLLSQNS